MTTLNLEGPQLGPELEQEEDPAPLLLVGGLHPPPSEAGEQEVGHDTRGDNETGVPVPVEEQLLDQSRVKKDVNGGQNDVEYNQHH